MKPSETIPCLLHCLCKVYNDIPSFSSILSAVGTCSYNLAKYFAPILRDLTFSDHTVSDSFYLRSEIQPWDEFLYLISFNIYRISLYSFSHKYSWRKCKKKKLKATLGGDFVLLLTLAVESSCLVNKLIFLVWGTPLGSTLNNSVLLHENWCLNYRLCNLNWTITAALLSKQASFIQIYFICVKDIQPTTTSGKVKESKH